MENGGKAVALKYDSSLPAPFISAKGAGAAALKIRQLAKEHHVPVLEMGALTEDLFLRQPGDYIPDYLFTVVAEVFSFIYSLQDSE